MAAVAAAGQAEDGTPGIHIPVGRAEPGKGRNHIDTAVILHRGGKVFRILGRDDEAHLIPEPLYHCAAHKDTALQRIADCAVQSDGDGGNQAVPGDAEL